jgi:hypothetical protein
MLVDLPQFFYVRTEFPFESNLCLETTQQETLLIVFRFVELHTGNPFSLLEICLLKKLCRIVPSFIYLVLLLLFIYKSFVVC